MTLGERAAAARRLLDRYLFPPPPPSSRGVAGWEKAVLVAGLLALAVFLQLLRIGWTGSLNSVWAEDGPVFLQGALTGSFWHALGTEYSGYLVVVPRLIAELASALPLRDAAATVAIASAAMVALSGLVVWSAAANQIADPYLRGALALATVLTPVGGLESIDSASYVSWYMLFAVFWILLWRPRTLAGAVAAGLFTALAVLSNPGAWFFLPLALLRALAVRDRRDAVIVGAYFGASALQLATVVDGAYEAVEPLWSRDIWTVLLQRVVDGAAFGLRLGGVAWAHLGWAFLIVLTVAVAIAFTLALARAEGRARALALLALATAGVMFVVSVYQRAVGPPMLWASGVYGGQGGRYAIVPVLLVLSAAMVALEGWRRRGGAGLPRWLPLALVGLVLLSTGASFWSADEEARGTPTWDAGLDAAAAACATQGGGEAQIVSSPPGFEMRLPCSAIPAASGATSPR
jgi:hypothetical protein